MKAGLILFSMICFFASCKKQASSNPPNPDNSIYFPPISGNTWETQTPSSLGWNTTALNNTYQFLEQKHTKAFIVLHNGRMVSEKYFGTFTSDSNWYWASVGKTLTAFLVGISQKENLLKIDEPTSKYLGAGWTSLSPVQESQITIRHQLSMTSGLNDGSNSDCTLPACLQYLAAPNTRWAYHNAPYTLLEKVVERASGKTYNAFFQEKIRNRIGMNGAWFRVGDYNNVYFSNARSMARFGLLMLAKGNWNGTAILNDELYFNSMVNSSQNLNPSYGYLTWLNGKASHLLPTLQFAFNGSMVHNAPPDMYCALGRDDQKIYVVPSKKLVVIRMGAAAGNVQLAASSFDNELWGYLKDVF
jgi:CubicO group peptidase (beta-lactamase class C family)